MPPMPKRVLQGTVVSDVNEKTVVVRVELRTAPADSDVRQVHLVVTDAGPGIPPRPARAEAVAASPAASDWPSSSRACCGYGRGGGG